MQSPDSSTAGHVNNFDFLRLLFATLVLVTHSYALTGLPSHDGLWQFSHEQVVLSSVAVHGFFVISGYLIIKSLLRSNSLQDYAFKRIIRLFPALWAVIGLTLIVAYFLSGMSPAAFLGNASAREYLFNLVLHIRYSIDGVFERNAWPDAINGSLWTVPYEMLAYLLLIPLFFIRQHITWVRFLLLAAFVALLSLQLGGSVHHESVRLIGLESEEGIVLGIYFLSGSILALFPALIRVSRTRLVLVGVSSAAMVVLFRIGGYAYAQFFVLPVVVITVGASNWLLLNWVRKYGDISYGVYLWGFPVQQCLWHFLQPSQPVMVLLSIPITWGLGFASWHLLEKRALRLKMQLSQPVPALTL